MKEAEAVSGDRVWQPWRMRANAGARVYSCGYCQWQVYQDSATCKECGKPIDWTHPRDLPFPCEEANTTTEIQVFQKWARGKRELSPYFVCDSDIEAVVRRLFPERPILGDMTTFWPRGMLPECEAEFREWWGRMGLRVERIGDTATARLVKIEDANRTRGIPESGTRIIDVCATCGEVPRLQRIEAAARRVEDEYDLPDLPECVEQLFEVVRGK